MGKYLYCIIKERNPKQLSIFGQQGKKVYIICEKGLGIVVSDSEVKEYDFIRDNLLCHQGVIEAVMKEGYDVLPVQFSTVADSEQKIKEKILKEKKKELLETFKIIEGRVELGLRVVWKDMKEVFAQISENAEIQRAKKEAQKNPTQFKIAEVGEMVEKALERKKEKLAKKILTPLKAISVDFRERELKGDSIILNSAFLVSKLKQKEFDRRIENLKKEKEEKIKFINVGPLPPFNFVKLHLKV